MGSDAYSWKAVAQPTVSVAPLNLEREDQHWRRFDDSMNAVSFGFVATAILVSMFLIMAIFERFLRPTSLPSGGSTTRSDVEAQMVFNRKISCPSPKMTIYANGVSVLMPGEEIPTFIAQAAPMPCPPERMLQPFHQHSRSFVL
ncbi:hypothetical protein HS088_TW06G00149 [Tripterygium wilfordii]|uniref:Uncharacterized protein n=1 Tax=Tripterygium wilfordii TaxID=458696 RepID=A0A7J7DIC3_TRIWF|nr:uncharacterized protein LOC120000847 [Tripterygium wilfordii]KAF5745984.1 hypothetical protein HS088_TW06G00149 [Tripterygium wilfordii]